MGTELSSRHKANSLLSEEFLQNFHSAGNKGHRFRFFTVIEDAFL